jgi:hypothetical protein
LFVKQLKDTKMSKGNFSLNKLYSDSMKVLFRPKAYFASMETGGGIGEPVIKALIYGIVAGVFILIWSLLDILGVTTGTFSGNVGVVGFFVNIAGAVVGVFIGGLIILIISYICSGKRNYEAGMRVTAAIMVVLPVNALLGFLGGISGALGVAVTLLIHLYGLYMLYHALTITLQGEKKPAKAISYILGALLVLFTIIGLFSKNSDQGSTRLNEQTDQQQVAIHQRTPEPEHFSRV